MKKTVPLISAALLMAFVVVLILSDVKNNDNPDTIGFEIGTKENPRARAEYAFNMLKNPVTGNIPDNIRKEELHFAKRMREEVQSQRSPVAAEFGSDNWNFAGPGNTGGRTRSLVIDVGDENTLIAGGVSGGIFKSVDQGYSWYSTFNTYDLPSVNCIAQDTRSGHSNTWYAGSGETEGNSADGGGDAIYRGNGIYKSTDNGESWELLESTMVDQPQDLASNFQFIHNLVVGPNMNEDWVYAATVGAVLLSGDGGDSWSMLMGRFDNDMSTHSNIDITSDGTVYASMSTQAVFASESPDAGFFKSDDGLNFEDITPSFAPDSYGRIIIEVDPSDENMVYFLGFSYGYGLTNHFLFKYDNSLSGEWTDLSDNLPYFPDNPDYNFSSQYAYDLCMGIKPNDETIILGGVNLYKSTDGFTTSDNTSVIGGYDLDNEPVPLYENSWVDQHVIRFLPSDNNVVFIGNDGGVRKILDVSQPEPVWMEMNHNYTTTQFYTIALDHENMDEINLLGGLQDRGSWGTTSDEMTDWEMVPVPGDGSYCAIVDASELYYISIQNGYILRVYEDDIYTRIDPADNGEDDYLFVNPFILDPNRPEVMYVTAKSVLYRNHNLNEIPFENEPEEQTSINWTRLDDTEVGSDEHYTAIDVSISPADIVYAGTEYGTVIRIDDAVEDPDVTDITPQIVPAGAYISSIAINPQDADQVIVCYSNYEVISLLYTDDGGQSWTDISGNFEENPDGSGMGPSTRWVKWMNRSSYDNIFVGSSVGLFATSDLMGSQTIWIESGADLIGNAVVMMMDVRHEDNLIAVATHGKGVFYAVFDPVGVEEINQVQLKLSDPYPNPATHAVQVDFTTDSKAEISLTIYDMNGREVNQEYLGTYASGTHSHKIQTDHLPPGIYTLVLKSSNQQYSKKLQIL